ncbi:hypothetical protein [Nocardioides sp. AE5]|uniref:hypothetical protein n=1 Tax=Nocardioides sp. AE5 TaxID=2962573 RepID=UPI0028820104|nr:hypothetical protein [Nocardioides sp. AE5]MDT0200921.1 hypothetical protein [Nocardioides sp. AE5]
MEPLTTLSPAGSDRGTVLAHLRNRIDRIQARQAPEALPTHPALAGALRLRAGGSYQVDDATLALALLAGPSAAGGWGAVVGAPDFGAEAATELGVDLSRTVLVPDPGPDWVEATAALLGVVQLLVLRPPETTLRTGVDPHLASRLGARLRKHGAVLVVHVPRPPSARSGPGTTTWQWPGCEARLGLQDATWSGIGPGHGRLQQRRAVVAVRRAGATPTFHPWPDREQRRTSAPVAPAAMDAFAGGLAGRAG